MEQSKQTGQSKLIRGKAWLGKNTAKKLIKMKWSATKKKAKISVWLRKKTDLSDWVEWLVKQINYQIFFYTHI